MHATIHLVIENQPAENKPPAARAARVRLMNEGLDRHEAMHAVGSVLSTWLFAVMKNNRPFDNAAYCHDLDELSVESWHNSAQAGDQ